MPSIHIPAASCILIAPIDALDRHIAVPCLSRSSYAASTPSLLLDRSAVASLRGLHANQPAADIPPYLHACSPINSTLSLRTLHTASLR